MTVNSSSNDDPKHETGNESFVYSIRDNVAGYFLPPFFAINDGHAKRMFIVGLGDSFPHRADFSLFCIGSWNDGDAALVPSDPRRVLSGVSISDTLDPRPAMMQRPAQEKGA